MVSKMKRFILLFCLYLVCDSKEDEREPKFFFGPKLQTVIAQKRIPEFITEFVPSSCFVIEPSLPPCRHVRNLEIYPSVPTRITKTQIPQIHNGQSIGDQNSRPIVHSSESIHRPTPPLQGKPQQVKTSSHWNWNLLNIFRVENITYTTTKTEYVTTKVEDPKTVVSFYIRGCRPSRLPFHLAECPRPVEVSKQQENIVVMAPLKFLSSDSLILPTKPENVSEIQPEIQPVEEDSTTENNTNN